MITEMKKSTIRVVVITGNNSTANSNAGQHQQEQETKGTTEFLSSKSKKVSVSNKRPASSANPVIFDIEYPPGKKCSAPAPEKLVWNCPILGCSKSYSRKDTLLIHLQSETHGGFKAFICKACPDIDFQHPTLISSLQNLRFHTFSFHLLNLRKSTNVVCKACGKKFSDRNEFFRHFQQAHSSQNAAICPVCGLAFPDATYLDKHVDFHLISSKSETQSSEKLILDLYFCDICLGAFDTNFSVMHHLIEEHGYSDYSEYIACFKCGSVFTSVEPYAQHVRDCTPQMDHVKHSVILQRKLVEDRGAISKRRASQRKIAPAQGTDLGLAMYQCQKCELDFMTAAKLAEHCEKIHQGQTASSHLLPQGINHKLRDISQGLFIKNVI